MAHSDKYLAAADKSRGLSRLYKAAHLKREPGRLQKDRRTIAIIDDDNSIRQALKRVLNTAGFRVHLYASAEDFLVALDTCPAGCAVVDLELGKMSGFELACHPAVVGAKLPIIFISGTADEAARAGAMALGCIEYLRKPFMPIELLGAIFRAVQETPQTS